MVHRKKMTIISRYYVVRITHYVLIDILQRQGARPRNVVHRTVRVVDSYKITNNDAT